MTLIEEYKALIEIRKTVAFYLKIIKKFIHKYLANKEEKAKKNLIIPQKI